MLFVSQCCQWQHNSVSAERQDVAVWIPVTVLVIASRWAALQTEAKGVRYSVCESRQKLHYFIRWESKCFCEWWRRAASYHLNHSEMFGYDPILTSSVFQQRVSFALAPYAKLSVSMQKAEHAAQHTDKQIIRHNAWWAWKTKSN